MLLWVALLLLVAAAAVAVRWLLGRVDALGRARPFPVLSVVVLALGGAGLLVPVVRHQQLEDRLAAVASELVGKPVTVTCQSASAEFIDAGAELGFVRYRADGTPEPATLIKRQQCGDLADYLADRGTNPSPDQVVAVHILTHESMHMAGLTNEGQAECAAVQRDAETARLLGALDSDADALARRYWTEVYHGLPEEYRSSDCRPPWAATS